MTIKLMNNVNSDNEIVNIGNDHEILISNLAQKLFHLINLYPKVIEKGAPIGSVMRRIPDLGKIRKMGDYVCNYSLDEGLKKTLEWYMKNSDQ